MICAFFNSFVAMIWNNDNDAVLFEFNMTSSLTFNCKAASF